MGKSVSTNYAYERGRYGGFVGSIIIHSVPGIGINNDPKTAVFKENLPAGYLKCDGGIKSGEDFFALANVLGTGDSSRYRKEGVTLIERDLSQNEYGQFQLPDLGSKVFAANFGTGDYIGTTLADDSTKSKVGVEVEVSSNVGNRASGFYVGIDENVGGNITVSGQTGLLFNGNVRYNSTLERSRYTARTQLDIENFQAHDHEANPVVLNYLGRHDISGVGKGSAANVNRGNSGAYDLIEETSVNVDNSIPHRHNVTFPFSFPSNPFEYSFTETECPIEDIIESYVDIEPENINKLDNVLTPFILVEYLIKF